MEPIAVVLAAGMGRKFWPYADVRNKCAFPIANEPLVARLVRQLREIGFARIVIVVGEAENSVRAALFPLAGDDLRFVPQKKPGAGTADAVQTALGFSGSPELNPAAFVVYGDSVVSTKDLEATWQLVSEQGAEAAILCASLNGERSQDCIGGSLQGEREKGGRRLTGMEGHGRDSTHRLAGVFALGPSVGAYLQSQPGYMAHVPVGGMPPLESELAEVIAAMQDDGRDIAALETTTPSVDMDKPWHILAATEVVLREMGTALTNSVVDPTSHISEGAELRGPVVVGPGAEIGHRVVIEGPCWIGANARVINGAIVGKGVMIGAGSRVSDYCLVGSGSVVGCDCVVGHGAEFEGVMLDRSYIYHYSEIYGVLGLAVDIGAATVCGTLRFDDDETIHRIGGRREYPRQGSNATYFGDFSRTGVNVITQPGTKIGAYSCVGAGIVLYEDVPSRKLILLKQETITRDWGPERYGW